MEANNTEIEDKLGRRLMSMDAIYGHNKEDNIKYYFFATIVILVIVLFLPWTQNIRSVGAVTTKRQEERPQQINSIIAGRILSWAVKEGDFVQKGDTIVHLAEIKDDYLDPQLLDRTGDQISAEQRTLDFYEDKIQTASSQIDALKQEKALKLQALDNKIIQVMRKVESDSMKLEAAKNEMIVADRQLDGAINMYEKDIIPLTEFEKRKVLHQNTNAKRIGAINDFNNSKQDLIIQQIEKNTVVQSYNEKIAKAQGEQFGSQSQIATGQGKVAKLQNQYENYKIRQGQYYVIAPQDGQIIKARKSGINEMVKEGEMIAEIVPTSFDKAVEIWVKPMDLQLLEIGNKMRFTFDGFPAIVFSGWPDATYGTFGGEVWAIENNVSANGMFRVLVAEDQHDRPWPKNLRLGGGAEAYALLNDVPIWYELWRKINGFPPDFYKDRNYTSDKKDATKN